MEDDILIDNYLKGLLSKNERESFLVRLESDDVFKEQFQLEEGLFNALDDNSWSFIEDKNPEIEDYKKLLQQEDLKDLKKTLAKTNSEFNSKNRKPTKRLFYYLAAASIVVLLAFQFFFNKTVSNQELYNDYIALYDLPSFVSRSDSSNQLVKAQNLFENKKYEEALVIFQSLERQSENLGILYVYEGIAQSELGKYYEAENTFNSLINSNLLDAEKGHWYKALLFIKSDKIEDAKKILNDIVSKDLYKNVEAKALLENIKH
ncbi:CDC27 family protein [Winogradskyella forsetii]|uniref:CDC27 family protein n=1 Tax=Winogradskyella forsetii TaxID=2686077 RepID=UPI0015BB623B|nr:CDC27 family protein [Winogradskyella forsetii]